MTDCFYNLTVDFSVTVGETKRGSTNLVRDYFIAIIMSNDADTPVSLMYEHSMEPILVKLAIVIDNLILMAIITVVMPTKVRTVTEIDVSNNATC